MHLRAHISRPVPLHSPTSITRAAGIIQERAHLPGHIVLQAGGRFAQVSDFNYTAARSLWLPQYGATYSPVHDLTLYGNYGALLSLGPQAPWWVDNASLFLTPFMTRQSEIGVKYERGILLTGDFFRMRQPFFYPARSRPTAFARQSSDRRRVMPGDCASSPKDTKLTMALN